MSLPQILNLQLKRLTVQLRSNLGTTQPLLDALSASVRGLVESRASLVEAVKQVAIIQAKSNLRETGFGCPSGSASRVVEEIIPINV